jgi:hypothetical protein
VIYKKTILNKTVENLKIQFEYFRWARWFVVFAWWIIPFPTPRTLSPLKLSFHRSKSTAIRVKWNFNHFFCFLLMVNWNVCD